MTDELLERVRAADPLPDGSTAPKFDSVFAALPEVVRNPGRVRRRRLVGLLVPAVSVAVAIGVLVLAVTVLHTGSRSRAHASATGGGRSLPAAPRGGMAGVVTVWGAGFNASGDGVISLERCLRCRPDGNLTKRSAITDWFLSTRDGGRKWSLGRRGYYLQGPNLTGRYGWAGGLQQLTRKQGAGPAMWEPGAGIARYFVSRDGGGTWSVAPSSAPNEGGSFPSVAGGEAWAVGLGLQVSVLHSGAHGTRLLATTSQPIPGDPTNVQIEGAGAGTAYVVNGDSPGQAFGTRDDGRSWQQLTRPPCTGNQSFTRLIGASGQTVWLTCLGGSAHSPVLMRSLDGGRSWTRLAENWGSYGPGQMVAASPTVAWALKSGGELLRTTDAGTTWQPVWSASDPRVSPFSRPVTRLTASPLPILSVQSAQSASIVTLLNRHADPRSARLTNLVVYRTTDGGRTWKAEPVHL